MSSYKSILDSLLDSVSNLIVARIRTLKDQFIDSSLNHLPASSENKIQSLGLKQFQLLAATIDNTLTKLFKEYDEELQVQFRQQNTNQYAKQLTGTNGNLCWREQVKEKEEKGIIITTHNTNYKGETNLSFTNLKEFLNYDKKVKQVTQLSINFKSQGMTDNNMEHFMKKFIQFYNIEQLYLNLGCNSLTVIGARQLAGCFTNLSHLAYLDISLYNNKITWEGIDAIMHSFKQLYNLRDLSLEVSCNPLGNKGFNIISKALPEIKKLQKLWLTVYDIGINDESFKIFTNEFAKLPQLLIVKLDFKVNPFNKKLITDVQKIIHQKKINNFEILI